MATDATVSISELNKVTPSLFPPTPTFFHAVSEWAWMTDGTWPFFQRCGTATKLGVIVEIEGRVLGWDAIWAHHAGPRKVKLRQIGWAHWKTKHTQPDYSGAWMMKIEGCGRVRMWSWFYRNVNLMGVSIKAGWQSASEMFNNSFRGVPLFS